MDLFALCTCKQLSYLFVAVLQHVITSEITYNSERTRGCQLYDFVSKTVYKKFGD